MRVLEDGDDARHRRLDALDALATSLLAGDDLHATLALVARSARELLDASTGGIGLPKDWPEPQPAGTPFVIAVAEGEGAETVLGAEIPVESLTGLIAQEHTEATETGAGDPRLSEAEARLAGSFGPALVAPLAVGGTVLGTLGVARHPGARPFSEHDRRTLDELARYAALVLAYAEAVAGRDRSVADLSRLYEGARRREALLAASGDSVRALLSGESPRKIIQDFAVHARELLAADMSAFLAPEGWPAPIPDADLVVIAATGASLLSKEPSFRLPRSDSLGGRAFDSGEPMLVEDVARADGAWAAGRGATRTGSALLVPVRVADEMAGVLVVANREGGGAFTPADLGDLVEIAQRVAITIDYERGQQGLRDLELAEDRERIARELHDTAIQGLYAAGITLQSATRSDTEPPPRDKLRLVGDGIARAIDDIRHSIFALRPRRRHPNGLLADLEILCAESTNVLGFTPTTRIDPAVTSLRGDVATELLAVLQEALSNAARHAEASTVEVSVSLNGELRLHVADDGGGPPDATKPGASTGRVGHGLTTMREAAERRGGACALEPRHPKGAQLVWRVPLARS